MGDYGAPNGVTGHPRVLSRRLINGRLADEYYQPLPPNSLAPCSGSEKLEVAIIGAGIAGLSAAIALTQSGHNVEVRTEQLRMEKVADERSFMRNRSSATR